ncbi:MAG: hypothetical protein KKF02_12975 [Proteobacteria bacterium]|nr:hypothetical protein [Pseudomonadota bacterium]
MKGGEGIVLIHPPTAKACEAPGGLARYGVTVSPARPDPGRRHAGGLASTGP